MPTPNLNNPIGYAICQLGGSVAAVDERKTPCCLVVHGQLRDIDEHFYTPDPPAFGKRRLWNRCCGGGRITERLTRPMRLRERKDEGCGMKAERSEQEMKLTAGERQLIKQLRDAMGKMDGKQAVSGVSGCGEWGVAYL